MLNFRKRQKQHSLERLCYKEVTDQNRRAAHGRTGIAAADFSRIRTADLGRFTVDRLMSILNRLGSRVEVKVRVRRAERISHEATA